MLVAGLLASAGANATTLKIDNSRGAPEARSVSIVDSAAVYPQSRAAGNWGHSVKVSGKEASATPEFFGAKKGNSGRVHFQGPGSSREIMAGNSGNVIPAALMAGFTPPGLQNAGRGLDMAPPDVTPVPLPAAAWLFISALMGLFLIGRKRKQYSAAS
ncbi:MAG: hypothetical protein ACNA7W_16095 [Pseudomonadales bacterium]